jgi:hypothetical protein
VEVVVMKEQLHVLAALGLLLGAVLACGGTQTATTRINTPQNAPARFLVTCGNETANCVLEANKDCPGGWNELSGELASSQSSSFAMVGQNAFARSETHTRRDWQIQCIGAHNPQVDADEKELAEWHRFQDPWH